MPIPVDYEERVYAGVLGKLIGVYLGRPFEGWTYERIMDQLGEVRFYVHDLLGVPLVVTDDDITGTFTFLRALPDHGNDRNLSASQIGHTWLNYIIEQRTILWWGGRGNSTEHTAFLNLKNGIEAPHSGSIATNGRIVAEQVGGQIFSDGWAMVAPGDPELAMELARKAASVSHDGEAVYAAQVLAAMESAAFLERDINRLLDIGMSCIPRDSVIYRLLDDLRNQHLQQPDWRETRRWIAATYGYDRFPGNCPVAPNHALIMLGLLYGEDDFQQTLMITNTSGWDTDCNSGNVGCLMGIKNGLAGIEAGPDWRAPIADRLFLPTADGGRTITDAVAETFRIANIGRCLASEPPLVPKGGARFHFELPGSVQGFLPEENTESQGTVDVRNVAGHSRHGRRCLVLRVQQLYGESVCRVGTSTFAVSEPPVMRTYPLIASPTLYAGQTVSAAVEADAANGGPLECRLYLCAYEKNDVLTRYCSSPVVCEPGSYNQLNWKLTEPKSAPIANVGIEVSGTGEIDAGTIYLDYLTWKGEPDIVLTRTGPEGQMWARSWINAVDQLETSRRLPFRCAQNYGTGLLIHGTREWTDYTVSATVTPHLCEASGIAARVQGMRRYYALVLRKGGDVALVKFLDRETVLAKVDYHWRFDQSYRLELAVQGNQLLGRVNHQQLFDVIDEDHALKGGGIALVIREGCMSSDAVTVRRLPSTRADEQKRRFVG